MPVDACQLWLRRAAGRCGSCSNMVGSATASCRATGADVSYAGLQERAAEGKQAEKDIPALTKCIEKLGEQLHQEEQVSLLASVLFHLEKEVRAPLVEAQELPLQKQPWLQRFLESSHA